MLFNTDDGMHDVIEKYGTHLFMFQFNLLSKMIMT